MGATPVLWYIVVDIPVPACQQMLYLIREYLMQIVRYNKYCIVIFIRRLLLDVTLTRSCWNSVMIYPLQILPIAHASGRRKRINLVNPQGVDLKAYIGRVEKAEQRYHKSVDLVSTQCNHRWLWGLGLTLNCLECAIFDQVAFSARMLPINDKSDSLKFKNMIFFIKWIFLYLMFS